VVDGVFQVRDSFIMMPILKQSDGVIIETWDSVGDHIGERAARVK
jgi:hypothetical protein